MENKFYSQFEEDKILNKLINIPKGLCIEIGGYDGVTGSNSYFFEQKGWDCIVVEPIPVYYEKIKMARNCIAINCAVSNSDEEDFFFVADSVEQLSSLTPDVERIKGFKGAELKKIRVNKRTLNSILKDYNVNKIDFISIDVEGHEMEVLKGFDIKKYKPSIIIIEDNSGGLDYTVENYLKLNNYILFKRTGCNDWYTLKDEKSTFYTKKDVQKVSAYKLKRYLKLKPYQLIKKITPSLLLNFYRKLKYKQKD